MTRLSLIGAMVSSAMYRALNGPFNSMDYLFVEPGLIFRRCRSAITPRPSPDDLVLLRDRCLIGEPDFYVGPRDILLFGDFTQAGRETS